MIFLQIPFHTSTLSFLLLCHRRLNSFTGSLLGAGPPSLWYNSITVINILRTTFQSVSYKLKITNRGKPTVRSSAAKHKLAARPN